MFWVQKVFVETLSRAEKSAADQLETTNKFDILQIGTPDFSAQDRISTKKF